MENIQELQHFRFLDYYEIQWSPNLLELGDLIEIRFDNQTEAYFDVNLPFYQLYSFIPVANDVIGEQFEKVHILKLSENQIRVYARTKTPYTGIFKVHYTAKGVR